MAATIPNDITKVEFHICPAHPHNLVYSIDNQIQLPNGDSINIWGLNAKRGKTMKNMSDDIANGKTVVCVFGRVHKKVFDYRRIAIFTGRILQEDNDNWPYRSPAGTPWKYIYEVQIVRTLTSAQAIQKSDALNLYIQRGIRSQYKVKDGDEKQKWFRYIQND